MDDKLTFWEPKNPSGVFEYADAGLYALAFMMTRTHGSTIDWGSPVRMSVQNGTGKAEFVFRPAPTSPAAG